MLCPHCGLVEAFMKPLPATPNYVVMSLLRLVEVMFNPLRYQVCTIFFTFKLGVGYCLPRGMHYHVFTPGSLRALTNVLFHPLLVRQPGIWLFSYCRRVGALYNPPPPSPKVLSRYELLPQFGLVGALMKPLRGTPTDIL